ncbi:TetR/AcrR family transcriptional regulator [Enterovibrio nigricans]|uniref:Transcriptional regulator, TetR family n=1 Tax=Enterovibrio nigricans DSM 22720 TaxID=1121868 RepID=A0A1T4TXE6_9GAMM|nr:TetR/AcrR family transcriptional regulator [Enterovibrio nigricans]PKF51452.1 TetR/AcrR family transcriptional regulator [Enterovibrio nigricans]SKA45152.1 transcriptional regulator, TetR family [Enterovibrio nigricans DSM 22720]
MATSSGRTRTRLSPQQRKEQLLKFAMEVFSKRGIGRAGHADIADMAHVSVATVFNYFPTREELVDVVLSEAESAFKNLILSNIHDDKNAHASLLRISDALIDAALDDKEWLKVWFEWSTSIREDIWPNYVNARKELLTRISSLFEAQGSERPMEHARMFDGICYILYLQAHQQPDKDALSLQAEGYIEMLCGK